MIDFAILPDEGDQTGWIEVVRVQVSFDLMSCHYSPTSREVTAAELEGLTKKAIRMKCPDSGDAYANVIANRLRGRDFDCHRIVSLHIMFFQYVGKSIAFVDVKVS